MTCIGGVSIAKEAIEIPFAGARDRLLAGFDDRLRVLCRLRARSYWPIALSR